MWLKSKRAFTLIELLIVVLIIGILSAIAIPMYQGAVDKSHWSTMLPGAKAIKDAEEAFKMSNDGYTDTMANLDVTMENSDLTFNLITPNNTSDPNVIRVTNSKLANVRLASYLDDSPKFAGQLHCEALAGDERANRLCGKLLMGQELTSADGYTGYLLDQSIDKATCDNANRSWSTSKTKCYQDTATRCSDLGVPVLENEDYSDQCGFVGHNVGAEGACIDDASARQCIAMAWGQGVVEEGGVCIGQRSKDSYQNIESCYSMTIKGAAICNGKENCGYSSTFDGGVCVANPSSSGLTCMYATYKNGSVCFANSANSCGASSYKDTSCCCGNYCGNSPACSEDRCAEAKAQYAKYFK